MNYLATITSKRQLTIPAELYRQLDFKEGERVMVFKTDKGMKIESAISLVDRLAGSVNTPKVYKKLSPDKMIIKAKKEYFNKR